MSATYRRSQRGDVIHRSWCTALSPGQGTPWNFAEGMTADQIVQTLAAAPWLRACKRCRPDVDSPSGGAA